MSKIASKSVRIDDERLLHINLTVENTADYTSVYIDLLGSHIEIGSVSQGAIFKNKIILTKEKGCDIYLVYPYDNDHIEVILSFLSNEDVIAHESFRISVDKRSPIQDSKNTFQSEKTDGMNFDMHMSTLSNELKQRNSKWNVILSINEDIIVDVLHSPKHSNWAAFGEPSDVLLSSDFLTKLDHHQKRLIIPIEIFWERYPKYKGNEFAIFELIQADFHLIEDIYYKKQISNTLQLSDFPRQKHHRLNDKVTTGQLFK